jgi:hypothetical protein
MKFLELHKLKISFVLLLAAGCSGAVVLPSLASADDGDPELYKEYPAPDEQQTFAHAAEMVRDIQQRLSKGAPIARAFHAKAHGCLQGTFKVLDSIPEDAKYGVFQPGAHYPIIGRFSNASGTPKSDKELDLRGFALKLDLGNSLTQDFLMTNGPVEFAKDTQEMMDFADASSRGFFPMAGFFLTHPSAAVILIQQISRKVPSVTSETYWSRVPYTIGPKAMKFNARPCSADQPQMPETTDTYLTDDLRARASKGQICFNFLMQFQKDPVAQPIEDATVEWQESDTPSIPVAQVIFPAQSFDSTDQLQACENMSYSPWHNVPDLRPMGNLNRARKSVYESSASFRGAQEYK